MTKSDPYAELFNAMSKTPAIPAGLSVNRTGEAIRETFGNDLVQIGADVGRVVGSAPAEQPHPMSCGEVGNVMPEVASDDETLVRKRWSGQCYVAKAVNAELYLIIVPARDQNEAGVGSGILSIGRTVAEAWKKASE